MPKFRKKPVVIEAHQWHKNGDHPEDFESHAPTDVEDRNVLASACEGEVVRYYRHPDVPGDSPCEQCGKPHHVHGWIDTLEQGHRVCPGDWIITGVKGERYPCKPDIFAATYEQVAESLMNEPIALSNPLPPGCHCQPGKCMAPVIMGRQTPCRDIAKRDAKP